ncbi:acyl-CoA dehydrogenase family protein [Robertmurraya massiliosenegalensis]|uniref:acyl-CoA dehydrogenase family protein n=1 Tax=Robertmurraya TaxID=2837507 RepID=UPI0039A5E110
MLVLNEEQELMRNIAREFAEKEVKPFVLEMELNNKYPAHLVKRMGELGFIGLPHDESYGGLGGQWTTYSIVLEEISKVSNTLGLLLVLETVMCGVTVAAGGTLEQKQKWLKPNFDGEKILAVSMTEPVGGFNYPEWQSRAVQDGDEWVLNAAKIFTTGAGQADYYIVGCMTSDFDPATNTGLSVFVVPANTPGVEVGHIENKLGWHGSSSGSMYYRNVRVPKENLIGEVNMGANFVNAMAPLECMLNGPMNLGAAEAAYEKVKTYTKERNQLGKSLYDTHQVIRHKLAKMYMEIESLRSFTYSTVAMQDEEQFCLPQQFALKIKGAEVLQYVANEAIQMHGGNGVVVENGVESCYRDAKVNAIGGGSNDTLLDMVTTMI